MAVRPYSLRNLKLGCEVTGIKLSENISDEIKQMIRDDVTKHRLLVFKHQDISPETHLAVGRWFGEIESTFYNHPKSPHRDIFRVSNVRSEGKNKLS